MKSVLFYVGAVIAVSAAMLMSGCGEESAAKKAVRATLKDPDSTKFGKYTPAGKGRGCLVVNAKNSMGGYTGDHMALVSSNGDEWWVLDINEHVSEKQCVSILEGLSKDSK